MTDQGTRSDAPDHRPSSGRGRRLAVTALSQAPSTLSNLVPSLVAAAVIAPAEFGRYSIVMTSVILGMSLGNAAVIQPFMARRKDGGRLAGRVLAWAVALTAIGTAAVAALSLRGCRLSALP